MKRLLIALALVTVAFGAPMLVRSQTTPVPGGSPGGGAPTTGTYLVQSANGAIPNAVVVSGRAVVYGSGTVAILDPSKMFFMTDEFASGGTTATTIGALAWSTAGGTITIQGAEAGRPGILRRETSATQNTDAYLHPRVTATTGIVSPADTFDLLWIVRVNQADTNTKVRFGLGNSAQGDPPNDGIYFERLDTDTNWFAVSRITSSTGRAVTGVAMGAAEWVRLRIWRSDASTVNYSINGTTVASTASVTNVMLQPFTFITNPTAAANKHMDHDYFDLVVGGLAR